MIPTSEESSTLNVPSDSPFALDQVKTRCPCLKFATKY